jgi:hypothetical protein
VEVTRKILTLSKRKSDAYEDQALAQGMGHRIAKHVLTSDNVLENSTYYVLDAQGNTMSVYERKVNELTQSIDFYQAEKHIYGSARLGVMNDSVGLFNSQNTNYGMYVIDHVIGKRNYELSNHLGNVLSVISDKPMPHQVGDMVDYFMADIRESHDYSPFGVLLYETTEPFWGRYLSVRWTWIFIEFFNWNKFNEIYLKV